MVVDSDSCETIPDSTFIEIPHDNLFSNGDQQWNKKQRKDCGDDGNVCSLVEWNFFLNKNQGGEKQSQNDGDAKKLYKHSEFIWVFDGSHFPDCFNKNDGNQRGEPGE